MDPFYPLMAALYHQQASLYGKKKILLLSYPRRLRENREDHRLSSIMKVHGIPEITSTRDLRVRGKKLFHRGEQVSFLVTNVDVKDIEPLNPGNENDYFSSSVHGFWDAYAGGGFGLSSHPGTECASDKEFYLYVEKMIHLYLKEIPIFRNIKTRSLILERSRDAVFEQLDRWVIKSTVGRGGKEVWIGKTLSLSSSERLRRRVELNPGNYVAQAFTELSQLAGHSVDARPLAIISSGKALVSDLPWGRGASAKKASKVNLCSGGVFVISNRAAQSE
jgi:uncharacterized circularly permuted ATP-grasp superfamily protein